MDKKAEYKGDPGQSLKKKKNKKSVPNPYKALKNFKKENPDLDIEMPPSKKQMRADGVLPPKKKKRSGTGNHPMNK